MIELTIESLVILADPAGSFCWKKSRF